MLLSYWRTLLYFCIGFFILDFIEGGLFLHNRGYGGGSYGYGGGGYGRGGGGYGHHGGYGKEGYAVDYDYYHVHLIQVNKTIKCAAKGGTCVNVGACNFTLNVYKFGLCGYNYSVVCCISRDIVCARDWGFCTNITDTCRAAGNYHSWFGCNATHRCCRPFVKKIATKKRVKLVKTGYSHGGGYGGGGYGGHEGDGYGYGGGGYGGRGRGGYGHGREGYGGRRYDGRGGGGYGGGGYDGYGGYGHGGEGYGHRGDGYGRRGYLKKKKK